MEVMEAMEATGPALATPLIEVRHLTKHYGDNVAVDDISFTVEEGEIFGFIGPNGAGKTTTIRVLSTLLEPTEGEVFIEGRCVQNDTEEVRRTIGYMPDQFGVYDGLTVEEYLDFFARAYRLSPKKRRSMIDDVIELTDLGGVRTRLVSTFSKGMKQRLCLAKTLIHDPRLLILDEPASALDPRARIELRMLLKELKRMGKTVFISSHILTELADICTSVGIIEKGELIECGRIETLGNKRRLVDRVAVFLAEERPEAVELVRREPRVREAAADGRKVTFDWEGPPEEFYQVLKLLVDNRIPVLSVEHDTPTLEHLFLELTKGDVK